MKKFKIVLVIVTAVAMLLAVGCTQGADETNNTSVTTTIVGGNPSGVWFALSTALSESLGNTYPGSVMHATPGQTHANVFRLDEYDVEFALTHSTQVFEAERGIGSFDSKLNNICGIASFYPSAAHFALNEDLGVTTFDEIIENKVPIRISIGSAGGTGEGTFIKLISLYGITIEEMNNWGCNIITAGNLESAELFADGQLDGMWKVTSAPTPTLTQAATNTDMVMITFSDEINRRMVEEFGYSSYTIKDGAYKFQTDDYQTFTSYTILAASLQTSDDVAYMVAKSIYENLEYISTVHSSLEGISAESIISNIGIALHPGAEKYYREAGLID